MTEPTGKGHSAVQTAYTGRVLLNAIMRSLAIVLVAAFLVVLTGTVGTRARFAAAQGACLSQSDQRAAVSSGQAVRPGQIGRELGGKVLRLNLCQSGGGLTWHVTVLQGDGRVVDHVVDAKSGRVIR